MTILLEGAVSGTEMTASLTVPLTSPYPDATTVVSLPDGVVDWIFLELRESLTGATVKEASAFVKTDGSVVNLSGERALPFRYTTGNSYYIVIKHRNHLSIMVDGKKPFGDVADAKTTIDVTAENSAHGTNALIQTDAGWAMYAGDINQDGEITTEDYTIWYNSARVGESGYKDTDVDMDGQVTTTDYTLWYNNARAGASSQVPEQD